MKSEEDKMIDDFLRESLGSYSEQPGPNVWQGIVQKLPYKPLGKFFPGSDGGILATLIGGVVITAGLVYLFTGNFDSKASRENAGNHVVSQQTQPKDNARIGTGSMASANTVTLDHTGLFSPLNKATKESLKYSSNSMAPVEKQTDAPAKNETAGNKADFVKSAKSNQLFADRSKVKAHMPGSKKSGTDPKADGLNNDKGNAHFSANGQSPILNEMKMSALFPIEPKQARLVASADKGFYFSALRDEASGNFPGLNQAQNEYFPSRGTFCLKAYYRPEMLKGNPGDSYAATRNTGGLSVSYVKSRISLETGLEYSRESRNQAYQVQLFEYLGTYQNLDSIDFVQNGSQVTPNYFYSTDSVFSPEMSAQKFNATATYSFVKIPLLIGMERQFGHFSAGFKGGVMVGILVAQSGNAFSNQFTESRIYSYESTSPTYKPTNMQWVMKADLDWNITPNFGLSLGPAINGYLADPYTRSKTTVDHPVYWGIQGGLFIKW